MDVDATNEFSSPVSARPALLPDDRAALIRGMKECSWIQKSWAEDERKMSAFYPIILMNLVEILNKTSLQKQVIQLSNGYNEASNILSQLTEEEFHKWKVGACDGIINDAWDSLVSHRLAEAYKTKFIGNAAINFVKFIKNFEDGLIFPRYELYCKVIPVVQSSGTGKSRMLTEVGEIIFTLPICFRMPGDQGYPRSDNSVWTYFGKVTKTNNLDIRAHHAMACFIGAAHEEMLMSLQQLMEKPVEPLDAEGLRKRWHECMEKEENGMYRQSFFEKVKVRADELTSQGCPYSLQDGSPKPTPKGFNPVEMAKQIYNKVAKGATKRLMDFITNLSHGGRALCVTYIDEAQEMAELYWVLLRLLKHQDEAIGMWYGVLGTESKLHYYAPEPQDYRSLRFVEEIMRFMPPFVALPLDLHASRSQGSELVNYCMGQFLTPQHLAQYGRPLWFAQVSGDKDSKPTLKDMVKMARAKLLSSRLFRPDDKDHVFAILSQRLCLEPNLANAEVNSLSDRSVAQHMKLLTNISNDRGRLHTYSPSEPILVLGAISHLYKAYQDDPLTPDTLGPVLTTFTQGLCNVGLIETGQLGGIAARLLLLTARDFTAIKMAKGDFLKPVRFLDVMDALLCRDEWDGDDRAAFENAFSNAYMNFTHWIVTEDSLPGVPDEDMLADLWSRNAILQCSHNRESLTFVGALYFGSVDDDAVFDPTRLAPLSAQIKLKIKPDTSAERHLRRPISIPRAGNLPHFALVMELGTEALHENGSNVKTTISSPVSDEEFYGCEKTLRDAQKQLLELKVKKAKEPDIDVQKKKWKRSNKR